MRSLYPIKSTNRIKKWNLDIIHTHTEGSMGTYGRLLGKQFNIPIVHTYHTMYEDYIYLVTKGHFDKPAKKLHPGDVVYIASEVKHWHGATKNHWFTHVALEISAENSSNEWYEKVDDDQYFFS